MADQHSVAKAISAAKQFDRNLNPKLHLKLWLDDYDSDHGWQIELSNVADFRLRESMFLKLPYGQLQFIDDGSYAESNMFSPGRLLYVGFEYSSIEEGATDDSISVGRYRISGVKILNRGKSDKIYTVTFIYDALALFNTVPVFPKGDEINRSTDVIAKICADAGLAFYTRTTTQDMMYWVNPGMNCYDFLNFVLDHSYIGQDDAGMFWVSKDGEAVFAGLRDSIANGIPFFFQSGAKNVQDSTKHLIFNDIYNDDIETMSDRELLSKYQNRCYILMTTDQRNNDSWTNSVSGNSTLVSYYDSNPSSNVINSNSSDDIVKSICDSVVTKKVTYSEILNGAPANDYDYRDSVRETKFNGYSNPDLHKSWEYAPTQNKTIRTEFFANRHTITINAGKQLNCFGEQDLRVGDVLDIDFTTPSNGLSLIDNGKYIVHTIDWIFNADSDLYMQLRVASDAVHPE